MSPSRIQDLDEVLRWIAEGRTYQWMCEEYERQYNIELTPNIFGNIRRAHRRVREAGAVVGDAHSDASTTSDLVPWQVRHEHRWAYPLAMLRTEARRRDGLRLAPSDQRRLEIWLDHMRDRGLVVHYDPSTEEGFFYVPRRPGIDRDLVRVVGTSSP